MPGWLNKSPCQCRCSRWLLKHCRVLHSGLKLLLRTLPKRGVQILSVWQLMRCACVMSACPSFCQEMKAKPRQRTCHRLMPRQRLQRSHRWRLCQSWPWRRRLPSPKPLSLYLHRSSWPRPRCLRRKQCLSSRLLCRRSHRLRRRKLCYRWMYRISCRPKLAKMWAAVLQHRCHAMVLRSTSFCLTLAMTLIFLSLLQQWLHKRSSQQHR